MDANIRLWSTREEFTHKKKKAINLKMLTMIRDSSRPPYIPTLSSRLRSHRGWVAVVVLASAVDVMF